MLIPNTVPNIEPLLKVGIILPEDMQGEVDLAISKSKDIIVKVDGSLIDFSGTSLKITVVNNKLNIEGEIGKTISIKQNKSNSFIAVNRVIAGRGFHWAKYIEVKLTYELDLKIVDGNLVLINTLPIEEYLSCVATSEMSAECPKSYIEAQTIVARSWMLANVEQKHVHLVFDVCNDDCCQRFQGINNLTEHSKIATQNTRGQVLMYKGEIVDARYSKSCGGIMEKFENLWENTPLDYMQNKSDAPEEFTVDLTDNNELKKWVNSVPKSFCSPHFIKEEELHKYLGHVDEQSKYFRWTIETTQEEITANIQEKLGIDIKQVLDIRPIKRAGSGRILELEIIYLNNNKEQITTIIYKDYEVRRVLHKMFLYSSAIDIKMIYDNNKIPAKFIFKGAGWGHGAGLCQIGGIGMSLAGYTTIKIVKHYYPGAGLEKIYA